MKILHYILGFPPYRTGGMTRFAYDLMLTQLELGHTVYALSPGEIGVFNKSVKIIRNSNINGIVNYDIINPLPIPYDEGILDIDSFTKKCDKKIYIDFLNSINIDVVHIHTLMGIHKEFIEACSDLKIKTIFTSHDFFPICPKVTLFRNGEICNTYTNCNNCYECNKHALSLKKMIFLQSNLYKRLKDTCLFKILRHNFKKNSALNSMECNDSSYKDDSMSSSYKKLRNYYIGILRMIDIVHYNSELTKNIYSDFITNKYKVIPISHHNITNNKSIKRFSNKIRFSYFGQLSIGKGYYFLIEQLDRLWTERQDFLLNVFFKPPENRPYIVVNDRFDHKSINSVMDNTDVLLVPSLFYETFGYVVLEALSFGVPVIVSSSVGAKQIIDEGCGIICNKDEWYDILNKINEELLRKINNNIFSKQKILSMEEFSKSIIDLYNSV